MNDIGGGLKNEMVVFGGYEGVHVVFGYGVRNVEGERLLEFGVRISLRHGVVSGKGYS